MPYVDDDQRDALTQPLLDTLRIIKRLAREKAFDEGRNCTGSPADELTAAAGILNYAITVLTVELTGKPAYWKCALLSGVLANAHDEYYRRLVAPYEDKKIIENGDVYPFVSCLPAPLPPLSPRARPPNVWGEKDAYPD